jgi:hypothetical protein
VAVVVLRARAGCFSRCCRHEGHGGAYKEKAREERRNSNRREFHLERLYGSEGYSYKKITFQSVSDSPRFHHTMKQEQSSIVVVESALTFCGLGLVELMAEEFSVTTRHSILGLVRVKWMVNSSKLVPKSSPRFGVFRPRSASSADLDLRLPDSDSHKD